MKIIDITQILSPDLKSRARAHDLKLFVENCAESDILIDFKNVKFATRGFIDEFYNLFVKDAASFEKKINITNVPEDINIMLNVVSKTQNKVKTIPQTAHVKYFKTIDEFMGYIGNPRSSTA